jgi:hypothetical protein
MLIDRNNVNAFVENLDLQQSLREWKARMDDYSAAKTPLDKIAVLFSLLPTNRQSDEKET